MKAAVRTRYGPPEVVRVIDVPTPEPGHGEVLVHVRASTVNRTDRGYRAGKPFIIRFFSGLVTPKVRGARDGVRGHRRGGWRRRQFVRSRRPRLRLQRAHLRCARRVHDDPRRRVDHDDPGGRDLRAGCAEPGGFALRACWSAGGQGRRRQRCPRLRRDRRDRFGGGAAGEVRWSNRHRSVSRRARNLGGEPRRRPRDRLHGRRLHSPRRDLRRRLRRRGQDVVRSV